MDGIQYLSRLDDPFDVFDDDEWNNHLPDDHDLSPERDIVLPETIRVGKYFQHVLRMYVTEPILINIIPPSFDANYLTILSFIFSSFSLQAAFAANLEEQRNPIVAFELRLLLCFLIACSMVLSCLDAMQVKRTRVFENSVEFLKKGLEAARKPLLIATLLVTIGTSGFSLGIGMLATCCMYNGQLVIYRHHNTMLKAPVSASWEQCLIIIAHLGFGFLFLIFSETSYLIQIIVVIFSLGCNIRQVYDSWFYLQHLQWVQDSQLKGHLRFIVTVLSFTLVFIFGLISRSVFIIGCVLISFRLNCRHLLITLKINAEKELSFDGQDDEETGDGWSWWILLSVLALAIWSLWKGTDPDVDMTIASKSVGNQSDPDGFVAIHPSTWLTTRKMVPYYPIIFFFSIIAAFVMDLVYSWKYIVMKSPHRTSWRIDTL